MAKRGTGKKKSSEQGRAISERVWHEIIGTITLAVSAILFLSLYHSGMGYVGGIIGNILMWTMGRAAWLIPTFVLVGGLLWLGKFDFDYTPRMFGLLLAGMSMAGLYHAGLQASEPFSISAARAGGGYLGALLYWLLRQGLGYVGMYVVLVAAMLVAALLLLNMPVSRLVFAAGTTVAQGGKQLWADMVDFVTQPEEKGSGESGSDGEQAQVGKRTGVPIRSYPGDCDEGKQPESEAADSAEPSASQVIQFPKTDGQKGQAKESSAAKDSQAEDSSDDDSEISMPGEPEQVRMDMEAIYTLPSPDLLTAQQEDDDSGRSRAQLNREAQKLESTLDSFGIDANVVEISHGPTVTRFDLRPGRGVKVSQISNLADDIALSLASAGVRVVAPVPGKSAVGIEVPNRELTPVFLREILQSAEFRSSEDPLTVGLGTDITGRPILARLGDLLHLLIAGATGSGKSICIRCLIASILFKARPDQVKFLLIDPKVVEFRSYDGLPHLLAPVVTDPQKAAGCLTWAVKEMERRYDKFAEAGVRDLQGYNRQAARFGEPQVPRLVIIIDELADLMTVARVDVEDAIQRLAQMARAAGIHLIVATQRPSVDVITGVIKANIPSRIAFAVSSGADSRTILDTGGAEKLVGSGDMLFAPVGREKPVRVQGSFLSDEDLGRLLDFVSQQAEPNFHEQVMQEAEKTSDSGSTEGEKDPKLEQAVELVLERGEASVSMLQRKLRVGYTRAGRLIDTMENMGVVGPHQGPKPRDVITTKSAYYEQKNDPSPQKEGDPQQNGHPIDGEDPPE